MTNRVTNVNIETMKNKYLLGVFGDEEHLLDAFEDLKANSYKIEEVYSPYPIHEILTGMGHKTRMTHAAFALGVVAVLGLLGFMYYAAVISWPLIYGGKPFNAFPSFIVVTLVATILIVTLGTLFFFSARAKIFPGKKAEIIHEGATDDKFVIVFNASDIKDNKDELYRLLKRHGVEDIVEK
ncbi:DUF3341 domain-containing protein [Puteibacter caeruleilacunae]|nr:DUF3341 domain-containing protein [Puteibacter caeruleilacunae]